MVRGIFSFHSHPLDKWSLHSEGFPAMVKAQTAAPNNVQLQGLITCRRTHPTHPSGGVFYGENPLHFSFPLVLLEITMVILITRSLRFLLKPLKQPRIVCDIIGGILIGPTVLGRNQEFGQHMFPVNATFVVKNIGIMGFMYFLFISGVKMDLEIMRKAGRKPWLIAVFGVLVPMMAVGVVALILRNSMDKELAKISSIGAVSSALAITAFPVIYPILKELNLLSSEVGRAALSTTIISDVIGINAVLAFEAATQAEGKKITALWYVISVVVIFALIIGLVPRVTGWIVSNTPEGKPVDQIFVIAILLGVLVIGFFTDMFGVAIANGPLWLGLAIPDGPPLGTTLVERSEIIIMEIIMPFSFAFVGLYTDVRSLSGGWSTLRPLLIMALTGYVVKMLVILVTALYLEMPYRDSLAFSLIMSLRGQVEFLLFVHWMDKRIIRIPEFTMMVLLTTTVTAIATPLISILYDPTRPYIINKRRTIQHTPPDTEIHMVACIHGQESVAGIVNLLEVSNPTPTSPFIVYALNLIELTGRASPVFIDHENQDISKNSEQSSNFTTIHNALKLYQESRQDLVKIHPFTAVSPRRSMYQDICELALTKKSTLIILPFHKECLDIHGGTEIVRQGVQSVNSNVLIHAPCSVGILVDRGPLQNNLVTRRSFNRRTIYHFAVLFLGGADAREALAYADRMAANPDVSLTVVRFLSQNYVGEDEMEKKLDDGIVTWFWVKNEANQRVIYREVVVRNGEETVAAINAMNDNYYDLWIAGRKQGINPVLLEGLSDWSENHELGVIGDYVAAMDFGGLASVLVVQQQVLREGMTSTSSQLAERIICKICS